MVSIGLYEVCFTCMAKGSKTTLYPYVKYFNEVK